MRGSVIIIDGVRYGQYLEEKNKVDYVAVAPLLTEDD